METRSIILNHLNKIGFIWDNKNSSEQNNIYRFNLTNTLFIVVEVSNTMVSVCSGLMQGEKKFIKSTSMTLEVMDIFVKPLNQLRDMIDQTMAHCLNAMLNFENEDEKPLKGKQD